jgi:AraC-like DNA-binding protein
MRMGAGSFERALAELIGDRFRQSQPIVAAPVADKPRSHHERGPGSDDPDAAARRPMSTVRANLLHAVGYFTSPVGGAPGPATIGSGSLLVELITAGLVFDPEQRERCGPGWIFIHHPGQRTLWRSPPGRHYECLTVHFDLTRVDGDVTWPRAFFWDPGEGSLAFAREMLHDFHHHGVDRDIQGELIWSQLRYRLAQFQRLEIPRALPPRIASVMAHIEANHTRDLGIDELAALVRLSPSHLHARFKDCLGATPHQYLVQHRMRTARRLLVATIDPISEIARQVGYAHTESFCRSFKRLHGNTAVAYRRRYARTPGGAGLAAAGAP